MQCARACCADLHPTFELAKTMAREQKDGRVPTDLVPRCPRCGGPMQLHLQIDRNFIPDEASQARLGDFLSRYRGKQLVALELGVGPRNPLVKAPVMRLVQSEPQATYITVNLGEVCIPPQIADKSFGVDARIEDALGRIREAMAR